MRRRDTRLQTELRQETSRELIRKIGSMDPYEGADPDEVEERLRNMNYGATHPRVTELRRTGIDPSDDDAATP